jgi:OOP family OmpA-OmpF porin
LEIQSDTGKADIKSKYNDEIAKVADFLKKYPTAKGTTEGHIDNVGGPAMEQEAFPKTCRECYELSCAEIQD